MQYNYQPLFDALDAIKLRLGLNSDSAIARRLGVTRQAVSIWRNQKGKPDDQTLRTIAKLSMRDFHVLRAEIAGAEPGTISSPYDTQIGSTLEELRKTPPDVKLFIAQQLMEWLYEDGFRASSTQKEMMPTAA